MINFDKKDLLKYSKLLFIPLLFFLTAFGLFFRYQLYSHAQSFWCDEILIVDNLDLKTYSQLFLPLKHNQCAPPLFMIIEKFIYSFSNGKESFLFFFPFLSSVLTFLIFIFSSFKIFNNKISVLFSTFICGISLSLLNYTGQLKQYSSDALAAIIILVLALYIKDKSLKPKQMLLWSGISILLVLFSYTAAPIIASVIITLFFYHYKKDKSFLFSKKNIKNCTCYFLPFVAFLITFLYTNCIETISNPRLQSYWNNPEYNTIFFPNNFYHFDRLLQFLTTGNGTAYSVCLILLIAIGLALFFKQNKYVFSIIFLTFCFAFTFGFFNIYPLSPDRVSVYLIPFSILLITKPIDLIFSLKNIKISALTAIILSAVYLCGFNYSQLLKLSKEYIYNENFNKLSLSKEFIQILYKSDISKNYLIFPNLYNDLVMNFYDKEKRYSKEQIILAFSDFEKELAKIETGKNIYFYMTDHDRYCTEYKKLYQWIDNSCKIIYSVDGYYATLIKCEKITP